MPVNAGYEYGEAQKRLNEARTPEDKIAALEHLLSVSPDHKGAETLRSEIKTKISKLKKQIEKDKKSKKGAGFSFAVKKEGAAQVVLLGLPNSGKSTILKRFTKSQVEIADYAFTTKVPEVGVMEHQGVKIQVVELPALFPGYSSSEKGPSFLAIAKSADLVCLVVDGTKDPAADLAAIETELKAGGLTLQKRNVRDSFAKPGIVMVNKLMKNFSCPYPVCWVDDFPQAVWGRLRLIWVRTKLPGREAAWPPVALEKGSTVKDLALKVHKDLVKQFQYARIWGTSVKHSGLSVGLEHILKEGDIVEIHTK
ncbi:50S ribosome-binding GTPase [Candidatus Woesearchaeota archaeon]|nr:50S ribosome-binding GTPase [Candidatus Woesearchaeota archaeon]